MKIRILDDSIRLRLDRDEVVRIGSGEAVSCQTRFPGGNSFEYRLQVDSGGASAAFDVRGIQVGIPAEELSRWAGDDSEVSLRAALPLGEGRLSVLVEKDFECLEPRPGESQSNRFRNPKKA